MRDAYSMNAVGNAIANLIKDALHEASSGIKEGVTNSTDAVVLGGCINGAITGVMQFMSDVADAGRLTDPDEKVQLMFQIAADVWTQIRGGRAGTAGGIQ